MVSCRYQLIIHKERDENMYIGNQIRNFRAEKKVTQEELAAYLNLSSQAVSKWETNASTPDITLLPAIATFFGVTIDELFAMPEEKQYERIENMLWQDRYMPQDTFEKAVRFLEEQAAKYNGNVRAYENLARLYNHRAAGDHARASEYAKRVIALEPDYKAGWGAFQEANRAACGDEYLDNHFEVIEYCREILREYPENYRALYTIIENLLADRRLDEALPFIERIGEAAPQYHQKLLYLGDVAAGKGDFKEAKRLWNRCVSEYPERWQAWCDRADRMKKLGDTECAIADLEKAMKVQDKPRLTDALHSLAQLHEQIGDYSAAIRDRERILAVLEEDYGVNTGEGVYSLKREIDRLKRHIEKQEQR